MFAMMLFLVRDVVPNSIGRGGTNRERRVTFLPAKVPVEILLDPIGRVLLKISHDIGYAMNWTKARHNMYMIVHAANNLRDTVHTPDDSTKIGMQSRPPFGADQRRSLLRREKQYGNAD